MKKAARFLEQRMARDIETITAVATDGCASTSRRSRSASSHRSWRLDRRRRLSQGTLDQLYLCARLGIVRQVTEPGTPPLIFDDPFVTFDADRAERAVKMLKELAREFQIIFMTSSDRYDAVADNVVVLPGTDRARRARATVDASATRRGDLDVVAHDA